MLPRGRPMKPTVIKKLEGNRGHRKLPQNEPRPEAVRPRCPKWLRVEAKREWRRVAPQLEAMGLLTKIDRVALAGYCQSYAKWREAEEFLMKHGSTFNIPKYAPAEEEGGKPKLVSIYMQAYPQVAIARQCLDQLRAFCVEFGLSPSSRGRLQMPDEREEDAMEQLLNFRRN